MAEEKEKISKIHLLGAEGVNSISFTDGERDLLYSEVLTNRKNFEIMRSYSIRNDIRPVLYFNPMMHGTQYNSKIISNSYTKVEAIELPVQDELIAYLPISQQADLIKNKKLSSKRLVGIYLERIKRLDPKVRSVITLLEKHAIEQAKVVDDEISENRYKGVLHGIPFGAKDLLSYPGYPTTWGATPFKNQILNEKARVIEKLENCGAILLAKLSLGALAWGDVWFDAQTKTPWNLTEGARGSSAGSGAALASGFISFAIGSETWGSIVAPATQSGITGLRPTFGRVSKFGAMALSWSMDKLGPMCRSVEDCAIVFNEIQGIDEMDQSTIDMPFKYDSSFDISTLKIGYTEREFDEEREYKKFDDQSLEQLKDQGVNLIPIKLPEFPAEAISFILFSEAAAAFDEITRSKEINSMIKQGKETWPNKFRVARYIPAVEYIKANRLRYVLIEEMHKLFREIDVYLAPSFSRNLLMTNLTGNPAIVIPNGFKENGIPHSITLNGNLFCEGELLSVAKTLQDSSKFHLERPSFVV